MWTIFLTCYLTRWTQCRGVSKSIHARVLSKLNSVRVPSQHCRRNLLSGNVPNSSHSKTTLSFFTSAVIRTRRCLISWPSFRMRTPRYGTMLRINGLNRKEKVMNLLRKNKVSILTRMNWDSMMAKIWSQSSTMTAEEILSLFMSDCRKIMKRSSRCMMRTQELTSVTLRKNSTKRKRRKRKKSTREKLCRNASLALRIKTTTSLLVKLWRDVWTQSTSTHGLCAVRSSMPLSDRFSSRVCLTAPLPNSYLNTEVILLPCPLSHILSLQTIVPRPALLQITKWRVSWLKRRQMNSSRWIVPQRRVSCNASSNRLPPPTLAR